MAEKQAQSAFWQTLSEGYQHSSACVKVAVLNLRPTDLQSICLLRTVPFCFRPQYASTGQDALIAKRFYLFCAFLTAQSGRPSTGGAAEFLALPKALSRSGMPFSSRRRGPISAPRLAISPTASRRSLMSGMLRKGRHSHCRSSLLPPAGHTYTHSQTTHTLRQHAG